MIRRRHGEQAPEPERPSKGERKRASHELQKLGEELIGLPDEILDQLQPGMIVEGQISNIVDFGAFVDLNGIDGLIHISELSWSHVNHPSEVINIGDTVQVKVLDIDRDRQRISLGLKQTQEDPWQRVVDTYNVGDELEGTVTKVVTFGAFVEILDGVEGLVHISELANHHVENPREVVQPGDDVLLVVAEQHQVRPVAGDCLDIRLEAGQLGAGCLRREIRLVVDGFDLIPGADRVQHLGCRRRERNDPFGPRRDRQGLAGCAFKGDRERCRGRGLAGRLGGTPATIVAAARVHP